MIAMMPKGVEHHSGPNPLMLDSAVLIAMMPKGVEHSGQRSPDRRGRLRVDRDDAERR